MLQYILKRYKGWHVWRVIIFLGAKILTPQKGTNYGPHRVEWYQTHCMNIKKKNNKKNPFTCILYIFFFFSFHSLLIIFRPVMSFVCMVILDNDHTCILMKRIHIHIYIPTYIYENKLQEKLKYKYMYYMNKKFSEVCFFFFFSSSFFLQLSYCRGA